ncbi:transcriptional repressor NrdR [Candidatus Gottesmanbacteria bacterium]|nr:transcriptional repressor NrdR [Candidatus Gottesmanbacteria bacterium]
MKCPYCGKDQSEVIETRDNDDLSATRRRRECTDCKKRFTTYERVENIELFVRKKDQRREPFNREKLRGGIMKACEKTSVSLEGVEKIIDEVERELRSQDSIEVDSKKIGQLVASKLKKYDKVAYIRFASVFRQFVDVEDFASEAQKLSESPKR